MRGGCCSAHGGIGAGLGTNWTLLRHHHHCCGPR
jgi:hypothetical protein